MNTSEALEMLKSTQEIAESTRNAIDSMQGIGQNKTSKQMAEALTALLNAVSKRLDSAPLV